MSNVFPRKSKKFRYVTSVFITYILFLLFAYAFFYALLPQIVNSIIDNIQNLKKYEQLLGDWLIELNERYAISKLQAGPTRRSMPGPWACWEAASSG